MSPKSCALCERKTLKLFVKSRDLAKLKDQRYGSREVSSKVRANYFSCAYCGLLNSDIKSYRTSAELEHVLALAPAANQLISRQAASTNRALLNRYVKPLPTQRILEIASSAGEFLELLSQDGFNDFKGVEPSAKALEGCALSIRPHIFQGLLKDFTSEEKFDLILCFQSIEHFEDLDATMIKMKKNLKEKGKIVFTCHNYDSFINKILGPFSPIYDYQHFYLFNPRALHFMATKYKLRLTLQKPFLNFYSLSYAMELFNLPHPDFFKKLVLPFPLGNQLAVFEL